MLAALNTVSLVLAAAWVISTLLCLISLILLLGKIIMNFAHHRSGLTREIKSLAIFCAISFSVALICFFSQSLCLHIFFTLGGHER